MDPQPSGDTFGRWGKGTISIFMSYLRGHAKWKKDKKNLLTNKKWNHQLKLLSKGDRKRLILWVPKGQSWSS